MGSLVGKSLVNLLKPSKLVFTYELLVFTINALLADLLIRQTFLPNA